MNQYEFAWRFGWRFPGFVLGFWLCMFGLAGLMSWSAGHDHAALQPQVYVTKPKPLHFKPLIPETKKPLTPNHSKPATWQQA